MTTDAQQVTRTVVFPLAEPTNRKQDKFDDVITEAQRVREIAANRMASVPRERWSVSRANTWYGWVKEIDPDLPTNTAAENIQKVREAFASWQSKGYPGDRPQLDAPECAYRHQQPWYEKTEKGYCISLQTGSGYGTRECIPIKAGGYLLPYLDALEQEEINKGRGVLVRHVDNYVFYQTYKKQREIETDIRTTIGVDVGFSNFATVSACTPTGKSGAKVWNGSKHKDKMMEKAKRRERAHAENRIEDVATEERDYSDDMCHKTSREIVEWASSYENPKIVMEELDGFHQDFTNEDGVTPRIIHVWPIAKLQRFIEYKAIDAGIPVEYVDSQGTSRQCNECGFSHEQNRSNSHFECLECGYQVNADVNAAMNIAQLGE